MALHHVAPGEVVDLQAIDPDQPRSTALVKTGSFEAMRLVLAAGAELAPHHVDGEFTLQCLSGAVRMPTGGTEISLAAGQWVYIAGGTPHSLHAIEDSVLLLTILLVGPQKG
jgi:quercetin dioxygenase-like cupin family protein